MKNTNVSVAFLLILGLIVVNVSWAAQTSDVEYTTPAPMKRSTSQREESLQEVWNRLSSSASSSLLKICLTLDMFSRLKSYKTGYNGTLADCIRPGSMILESECGIYASDPDAYDTFSELFYPIIRAYHKIQEVEQPKPDFGVPRILTFGDLDPEGLFIKSVRISARRSYANYGFPPTTTNKDRIKMERMTVEALNTLEGELAGTYTPLFGMSKQTYKTIAEVFAVKLDDPEKRNAKVYRDWPRGRGVFFSHDKKFLVLLNEEDHLLIVSMQNGGNLAAVWQRLVKGLTLLEKKVTFVHHPKLGFLTFSPTNIGTSLNISVRIRIPNLSKNVTNFNELCERLNLHQEGIAGEVFDISNKKRMGLTEREILEQMRVGVMFIKKMEAELHNVGKL